EVGPPELPDALPTAAGIRLVPEGRVALGDLLRVVHHSPLSSGSVVSHGVSGAARSLLFVVMEGRYDNRPRTGHLVGPRRRHQLAFAKRTLPMAAKSAGESSGVQPPVSAPCC